ncbi:hypothetical protein VNO78_01050 [Psophocarpus tetragonolobus]|uniref:Uncharacterized protein n=1 Tax=Psophocarpus tetragonolobus TaxID=3891 RepID=A0AAN9XVC1_PSOTE
MHGSTASSAMHYANNQKYILDDSQEHLAMQRPELFNHTCIFLRYTNTTKIRQVQRPPKPLNVQTHRKGFPTNEFKKKTKQIIS